MSRTDLLKVAGLMLVASVFVLAGCEGDEGPAGPPGADGEDAGIFDFTFVGDKGESCSHCHSTTVDDVMATGHTHAYDNMDAEDQADPYCLQCHTTGWDRHVDFGSDEWMTATNPDENGYDDYYDVAGDEAAARRASLEGVQCEACHGAMGPDFNDHRPLIGFGDIGTHIPGEITADDITSLCYRCHHTQFEGPAGDFSDGYAASGHANSEGGDLEAHADHFGRSSCNACHTSEGFIMANDPVYASYDFGGEYNFIGCVTCHDPHKGSDTGGNAAQLRSVGPAALNYSFPYEPGDDEAPVIDGYGQGQLCAQCHHGRRDNANVAGQIANGYAHFGPHHSAQGDMMIGYGSYEIPGYDYEAGRTHSHQGVTNSCVACHMVREVELHGELQDHAFHNFVPEFSTNCAGCHPSFTEESVTEFQATIEGLMDDLATRFGYTDYHDMEENWDSTEASVTSWEREAAYAMFFLIGDGSLGVHNPNYAEALMNNAITYYDANTP